VIINNVAFMTLTGFCQISLQLLMQCGKFVEYVRCCAETPRCESFCWHGGKLLYMWLDSSVQLQLWS